MSTASRLGSALRGASLPRPRRCLANHAARRVRHPNRPKCLFSFRRRPAPDDRKRSPRPCSLGAQVGNHQTFAPDLGLL
eukprot:4067491-Pyramimonas_sp.AAC.1